MAKDEADLPAFQLPEGLTTHPHFSDAFQNLPHNCTGRAMQPNVKSDDSAFQTNEFGRSSNGLTLNSEGCDFACSRTGTQHTAYQDIHFPFISENTHFGEDLRYSVQNTGLLRRPPQTEPSAQLFDTEQLTPSSCQQPNETNASSTTAASSTRPSLDHFPEERPQLNTDEATEEAVRSMETSELAQELEGNRLSESVQYGDAQLTVEQSVPSDSGCNTGPDLPAQATLRRPKSSVAAATNHLIRR